MPAIDLSILNQRQTPAFYADVFANRPAAGFVGRIFVSTNTFAFYRDNGTGWDLIGGPGSGTITGSGSFGSIALWNGTDTITYDVGLTWDGTANSLTASKFIVSGGTSSQFLKGDGSLDSNTYNTGSGAVGQVTFWNGTNAITGGNDLFWDSANGHLGVNTNVPGTALDVHHDQPTVAILNQTVATNDVRIGFQNNGVGLWRIGAFYNAGANDFGIYDAVAAIQPVTVKKTTGQVLIGTSTVGSGKLVVASATSDNGIQIVGANAPSLRIDSAESGPTKRIGLGISTGVNNFIQGSVDRDMCIFNGSTTASPMLFGIYDTTNVQEAARITPARNFLIGTTTDAGYKLDVNGISRVSGNFSVWNGSIYAGVGGPATSRGFYAGNTGFEASFLYNNSTGNLDISPRSGYNTIITSGNVGIGETNPSAPLYITNSTAQITLNSTGAGQDKRLYFRDSFGSGLSYITSSSTLYFGAGGFSRIDMTLANATGNLLIGTTTDNGNKLQVNGNISISNGNTIFAYTQTGGYNAMVIQNTSNNTNARCIEFRGWNNSVTGSIETYVNVTAYNTSSDYRLKEDLKEFNGLSLINSIKTYDFKWKESENRMYGVIAHELQSVLPYAVSGEKDGKDNQGVDYSKIVPLLVKAIQELNTKIENLK